MKIMFYLNKQKIIVAFVTLLFLGGTKILACECSILAVEETFEKSTAVFSGKVVGFEYRKGISNPLMERREKQTGQKFNYETMVVKFQVERWWKAEAALEIFLVTTETKFGDGTSSHSSCDYSFTEGESYLIYAFGKENELRTNFCRRTRLLSKAEEDMKILGEGKKPVEKKDEPKKSMEQRRNQLHS